MKRALLLLAALPALFLPGAACGGVTHSGMFGSVRKGPTRPVCRVGTPCTAPAPGVTLVFSRQGVPDRRVRTNNRGMYRIALRPGSYSVRLLRRPSIGRGLAPRTAKVPSGRFAHVNFMLDTGIR